MALRPSVELIFLTFSLGPAAVGNAQLINPGSAAREFSNIFWLTSLAGDMKASGHAVHLHSGDSGPVIFL